MFRQIAIFLVAIVAFTSAFAPAARFGSRVNTALDAARCEARLVDKNGRCPGDSGYVSFTKADPGDFASFKAAQNKAKPASSGRCEEKQIDKNGRCPGDSGYVSFTKADPGDFAAFKAAQAAKKR